MLNDNCVNRQHRITHKPQVNVIGVKNRGPIWRDILPLVTTIDLHVEKFLLALFVLTWLMYHRCEDFVLDFMK